MLSIEQRIKAFARLGKYMETALRQEDAALLRAIQEASRQNQWFTADQVNFALKKWSELLNEAALTAWLKPYESSIQKSTPRTIGVVNAGNIPMVAFHDFMSVLLSGHRYQGKNSSDDSILLPFFSERLMEIEPGFNDYISFMGRLKDFDAVIATGSNNSARYFEYYFGKYPHVIRKNRTGVALLDGTESREQLETLGEDVFRYFGLGCRSISHLLLPKGYDLPKLLDAFEKYADIRHHNKYINNYDYYKAVLILKKIPFLDNGFLIVKQDNAFATPVSILNYSYYANFGEAEKILEEKREEIQGIVSSRHIPFGSAQHPALDDYADGVNTLDFLSEQ